MSERPPREFLRVNVEEEAKRCGTCRFWSRYQIELYSSDMIDRSATEKLGEVLGYLARKKEGMLSDYRYEDDPEIVREAKSGLKEHLTMLPRLDENGNAISWPPKALKYLRKDYKLIDRRKFDIGTIRFGPDHNPWRPYENLG